MPKRDIVRTPRSLRTEIRPYTYVYSAIQVKKDTARKKVVFQYREYFCLTCPTEVVNAVKITKNTYPFTKKTIVSII